MLGTKILSFRLFKSEEEIRQEEEAKKIAIEESKRTADALEVMRKEEEIKLMYGIKEFFRNRKKLNEQVKQ
jgi:hypothetical protein